MIGNTISNKEWFSDVLFESQATGLFPISLEWEANPWPVRRTGLAMRTARPALALSSINLRLRKSNEPTSQLQKLLAATNSTTFPPPWLMPCRTIGTYMDGGYINFVDVTSLKQTEAKLLQKQEQLESLNEDLVKLVAERTEQVRQLASEVLIAEQKVQEAVSQILHDDLQQVLFSIQIQTDMLHSSLPVSEHVLLDQIQEIRNGVNLAFQVTRQVVVDLTQPFLLHQNFMEALDFLAALMERMYGLKVTLKGSHLSIRPKEEVSNLLFQIVRELLFNVVKHARVNQAQVEVAQEDGRLSIVVSDNGQGFSVVDSMQPRNSLGLFTIRRRVKLFGGQFHIESQADQGMRVAVVMWV